MEYTQSDVDRILEASEKANMGPYYITAKNEIFDASKKFCIAEAFDMGCMGDEDANCELLAGAPILSEEVKRLRDKMEHIFAIANNAIYFDDSSDFASALYEIASLIDPDRCVGDNYIGDDK